MKLTPQTALSLIFPPCADAVRCSWADFQAENAEAFDALEMNRVRIDLESQGFASGGGGAAAYWLASVAAPDWPLHADGSPDIGEGLNMAQGVVFMAEAARALALIVGRMAALYEACPDLNDVQPRSAAESYAASLDEWAPVCSEAAREWEAMAGGHGAGRLARTLGYRLRHADSGPPVPGCIPEGVHYVRPNGEEDSEAFEDEAAAWRAADSDATLWELDRA